MDALPLPKTPGIYKIYFLSPERFYIGSAVNLRNRRRQHIESLRRSDHNNSRMQNAYAKYGDESFHFEIVELIEQKAELLIREQHYIDTLGPYYNINPVAWSSLGVKRAPETRAKVSMAHKGQIAWNKGMTMPAEYRAKLSVSHKGKSPSNKGVPCTEEHKQKQREAMKGRPAPNKGKKGQIPWNKGVPMPEEQKRKVSAAKMGSPSPRKGAVLSEETKERIRATNRNKSPEEKARLSAKSWAVRRANAARNQPSLWDDNAFSD